MDCHRTFPFALQGSAAKVGVARSEAGRALGSWLSHAGGNALRALLLLVALGAAPACTTSAEAGLVRVDGSSTVYPLNEAMAEEFLLQVGGRVVVGVSGTGGGMQRLCEGSIDVAAASRPIRQSELDRCAAHGIEVVELPVAWDGVVLAIHPANHWAREMTLEQVRKIWAPEAQGRLMRWSDVSPEWPDRPLHLLGAGVSSGTYDYFTEVVGGERGASRGDFMSSEDDNVLVRGVASDENALGYFGFAYYIENAGVLQAVAVDDEKVENGDGPQLPSMQTIEQSLYQPLSRPLIIYVRRDAADVPAVRDWVDFYLSNAATLARESGFVAFPDSTMKLVKQRFAQRLTGSVLNRMHPGDDLARLLTEAPHAQ